MRSRVVRAASLVIILLSWLAVSGGEAQVAPPAPPGFAPSSHSSTSDLLVRDGTEVWSVRRDPHDPARVSAFSPRGGILRARVDEHALVRIAPGFDARETLHSLGIIPVREVAAALRAWRVIDAQGGDGLALAARLAAHVGPGRPLVDAIPDWIVAHQTDAIRVPPDDPRYPGQWYLERLGIEDAWRLSVGDPSVTIVVVDTGCDGTHADLVTKLDPGRDVIDVDDDPTPPAGERGNAHGTACAGLAAAGTDNGEGIAGACPECRLRCVRMLGGRASEGSISADVAAFQFALEVDAAVVSNSWGFVEVTPIPSVLREIIEQVVDEGRGGRGALVLFASGNDNREIFDYELQAVRGVLTVGAVNNFDEATAFSNRGAAVDIVAPTGTLTTDIAGPDGDDPGDYTSSFGGTSSACPLAAGVAGLLASAAPEMSGEELARAMIETAKPSLFATPDETGHDPLYGYGRIQPAEALRYVLGLPETTADAGVTGDAAGALDGSAGVAPNTTGCACRAAGWTASYHSAWIPWALALAARLRPRRRRPRVAANVRRAHPRAASYPRA